jgi:hypothetical protein
MKLIVYLFTYFIASATFANSTIAITVALEPDSTMVSRAKTVNETLKGAYPQGYALDEFHNPHITLVQRFVRTDDLEKVYSAIDQVIAATDFKKLNLEAQGYNSQVWDGLDLVMIKVKKSDDLVKLQEKLVSAINPFSVDGDKSSFALTKSEPGINKETITHVREYIPKSIGENYKPNVTVGVISHGEKDKKLGKTFDNFKFTPVAVSVFKIGNFGAAHERLKTWK